MITSIPENAGYLINKRLMNSQIGQIPQALGIGALILMGFLPAILGSVAGYHIAKASSDKKGLRTVGGIVGFFALPATLFAISKVVGKI